MVFRDPTHHSGAQIQDWTYKNHAQVSAQVLMGAGLLRKYRNGTVSTNYPTPTLVRLLCACFTTPRRPSYVCCAPVLAGVRWVVGLQLGPGPFTLLLRLRREGIKTVISFWPPCPSPPPPSSFPLASFVYFESTQSNVNFFSTNFATAALISISRALAGQWTGYSGSRGTPRTSTHMTTRAAPGGILTSPPCSSRG